MANPTDPTDDWRERRDELLRMVGCADVNVLRNAIRETAERLATLRQTLARIQREAAQRSREQFDREIQAILKGAKL